MPRLQKLLANLSSLPLELLEFEPQIRLCPERSTPPPIEPGSDESAMNSREATVPAAPPSTLHHTLPCATMHL
jgi:hypothetical protein